jgi:hypothetical protein
MYIEIIKAKSVKVIVNICFWLLVSESIYLPKNKNIRIVAISFKPMEEYLI